MKMLPGFSEEQSMQRLATRLVRTVCDTFAQIQEQQREILIDLGQTTQDRFRLSAVLASSLYDTGMPGLSHKRLHTVMSEGELHAILYALVCGDAPERIIRQTTVRLLQRSEFRHVIIRSSRHYSVSQVPATDQQPAHSGRRGQPRTHRAVASRTGEQYQSHMSSLLV